MTAAARRPPDWPAVPPAAFLTTHGNLFVDLLLDELRLQVQGLTDDDDRRRRESGDAIRDPAAFAAYAAGLADAYHRLCGLERPW